MRTIVKALAAGCMCVAFAGTISMHVYADAAKSVHPVTLVAAPADYENIAVSQVTDYVNIRKEANTDSDIVGKIYNNCAATILETVEGEGGKWYRIQSGTVNGFIKAQYFITGAEAETLAQSIGREFVTINTESLRLREEPNLTSNTLTLLSQGARYVVKADAGEFFQVEIDSDLVGYVSKDYCKAEVEFDQAVSLGEEAAKKEEEARRKQEADAAIAALQQVILVEAKQENTDSSNTSGQAAARPGEGQLIIEANPGVSGSQTGSGQTEAGQDSKPAADVKPGSSQPGSSTGTDSGSNPPQAAVIQGAAPGGSSSSSSGSQAPGSQPQSSSKPAGNSQGEKPSASVVLAGGGPGSAAVASATRTAIVAYAKQFLGNPYVYGGTSLTNGADCSGFTQSIFKNFGIEIGRSSRDQAANGKEISISAVQPGDLLFYGSGSYINHVALYIGGGQVIHSSNERTGILIAPANYRTPCKAVTFLD